MRLKRHGRRAKRASVIGRAVAGGLDPSLLAVALGFAVGAAIASLADTLMPEAFEHGRPLNAFATAAGFFLPSCSPLKRPGIYAAEAMLARA